MEQQNAKKSLGLGCLAVFALPFALIGIYMAYLTVATVLRSNIMSGWPTSPATLHSLELKSSRGSKSTTHSVAASYSYEISGQRYHGNRVSLYTSDNVGTYHQDLYAELAAKKKSGKSIAVHVDPEDPTQSIVRPDLRLGMLAFYMIFVVTFGTFGWGIIVGAILGWRRQKEELALQQLHPSEPWLWDAQWKSRKITSQQKSIALFLFFAAVFWNAISLPILFIIPREIKQGNYAVLLALLFTVVGIGLIYAAVVAVARWRRFGQAWFELQTLPVRPGASLRGVIHPGKRFEGVASMTVELQCCRITRTRSNSSYSSRSQKSYRHRKSRTSTRTEVVWDTKLDIPSQKISTAIHESPVQIEIAVPEDALSTSTDGIRWTVSAHAVMSGADFKAEFEVPVFRQDEKGAGRGDI